MSGPLTMVVALGGNAIAPPGCEGNIAQQFEVTRQVSKVLADCIEAGHRMVITHGNGPQVGNILRRVEIASKEVYTIDLGLCVADTQAGIGYMICQCLGNELQRRGSSQRACTIITTVLVDADDPAFRNPTKPIGSYYNKEDADRYRTQDGWNMVEVPGLGYRRIVPSPRPREIQQLPMIQALVDAGELVVACGGGGIPVVAREGWGLEGIDAVIDKDLTAALLATGTGADLLAILTGVERVCLNYQKPDEQPLDRLTIREAQSLLDAGQFPTGSMGPKIEAGIQFLQRSQAHEPRVLITATDKLKEALAGQTGTWLVRD